MDNEEIFNAMGVNDNIAKKKTKKTTNIKTLHNTYIKSVKFLSSLFFIACVIGGIILGNEYEIPYATYNGHTYSKFNTLIMLISWITGFVSYAIMYGIACIVENTEK